MLSIILSVRNTGPLAAQCLSSLLRAIQILVPAQVEIILIDDASDPAQRIPKLFADFRKQMRAGAEVVVFQFQQHQHYTRGLAYGLSRAKGNAILFVSHDMMLTADYVRTLVAVAATDPTIGLVRGISPYVDAFPQHEVRPPFQIRSFEDLDAFARYISEYGGLHWVEDPFLTGDSMLITRAAIEKIGVFDPRYPSYFGDIDFGLRLQRAGLKMVCAKGAWLWHEGEGEHKHVQAQTGESYNAVHARRMQTVNDAYRAFREKWDHSLPVTYPGTADIDFSRLRNLPPLLESEYQPPVTPNPSICRILAS